MIIPDRPVAGDLVQNMSMKTERPRFIPSAAHRQFAAIFTAEDWLFLTAIPEFNAALEDWEFGQAEVIARVRLFERDRASIDVGALAMVARDEAHEAVAEFVRIWALRCGRQNHIRRLMAHGLDSNYAAAMKREMA